MESGKENIDEITIIAYLNGAELHEKQRQTVERWLQNESNREEAQKIYQAWELSGLFSNKKVDAQTALRSVKSKAGLSRENSVSWQTWTKLGVAACVLIGILTALWLIDGDKVKDELIVRAGDANKDYQLPDSSRVTLRRASALRWDKENFAAGLRNVYLEGEAYFDVQHYPPRPFIVTTHDAQVVVVGTKFMVKSLPKVPTQVLVTEGIVKVITSTKNTTDTLRAGEEMEVSTSAGSRIEKMDINHLYWKTGVLRFEGDKLAKVFDALEHEFGVSIEVENRQILSCRFTSTFSEQPMDMIMNVIAETFQLNIRKEDNTIYVNGNGCE